MYRKFLIYILLTFVVVLAASADAVGTWKLYQSYSTINSVEPTGNKVFVVADGNLYSYNVKTTEIREYNITTEPALNGRKITHMIWVKAVNKLFVVYSNYVIDILSTRDKISSISGLKNASSLKDKTVKSIAVSGQYVFLTTAMGILKIDAKDEYIIKTYGLEDEVPGMSSASGSTTTKDGPYGVVSYDATNKCWWGADADGKLTKYIEKDGELVAASTGVRPEGPTYKEHTNIKLNNGKLYSVRGLYEGWGAEGDISNPGYLQIYDVVNNSWSVADNSYADTRGKVHTQFTCIDVDPRDSKHIVVGAKSGLYEFYDGKMTAFYDCESGTPIKSTISESFPTEIRRQNTVISAVKYDSNGNLWIFNQGNTVMICLASNGEWKSLELTGISKMERYKNPIFDSRGLMWFANDFWNPYSYGFYDTKSNQFRVSTSLINQDGATMNSYGPLGRAVAEDDENNIWYATADGPFYLTPENVTYMCNNTDLSGLRINQYKVNRNDGSGLADYLLAGVSITDVLIDAGNRKWFATGGNGLYCISADNNSELHHFTTENSPLPSNEIKKLAWDGENGVMYIGTYYGLCSYQSDVTQNYGDLNSDNVYAYPNPVEPNFTGDITIMGLTDGAHITITSTSGYVVNKGTCVGGSYTWNGCDRGGERVASGVYNVLVATSEGESGCVTKIAVIR